MPSGKSPLQEIVWVINNKYGKFLCHMLKTSGFAIIYQSLIEN